MQGFCGPLSAAPREDIDFHVSTESAKYSVTFVRFANKDPNVVTAADICNSNELAELLATDVVLHLDGASQPLHTPDTPISPGEAPATRT